MSKKLKHQDNNEAQGGGNVVAMPTRCKAQGCNKKSDRMDFCNEHYEWFKFGLLTKMGEKPIDFDKKFISFQKHKKAA